MKALIWDVDGTLAETERDGHRVAFNEAFEALGVPWRWSEARYGELLRVTGGYERLLHDMGAQRAAPAAPAEREALARELHAVKNRRYAEAVAQGGIPLRPGVIALMDDCSAAGLPMAIATTTGRANVEALLAAQLGAQWASRFACVLGAEDAPQKKPDPQVYLMALERLGLAGPEVVAIEDSSPGLRACAAAAVPVVVTRSIYFADLPAEGALAAGPGLEDGAGWTPEAVPGRRIDLAQLRRWHAASASR